MTEQKFMDACLNGDALSEDIETYIEEWHESESTEEVFEYLGMTEEEYGLWVENDGILRSIFAARQLKMTITDYLKRNIGESLAARSFSPEEAASVREWLIRTKRIEE
ncbi:hypothetical protein [Paenibacillus polysaccharolyticus]|uniref:hypothetical protein n=1 Tax=Paenibacillus polysaccharolyticus TaxID=582692 RepID=UPI0030091EC6